MRKGYIKRFAICIAALFFVGAGNLLGVKAGSAGTNAWNTLSIGLSDTLGITFGTATLAISIAIILIDLLGKGKIGFGTILSSALVAVFSDWFLKVFSFMPEASNMIQGCLYTLAGQIVISYAMVIYMTPLLGCGPRDMLMVIVGRKMPRAPIGLVKFLLEVGALGGGFLLGAPVGIGTILVMALQASLFQFACKTCRFEPRDAVHEDVIDTLKAIFGKNG